MRLGAQSALLLLLGVGCGTGEKTSEPGRAPASEQVETAHSKRAAGPGVADVPPLEAPPEGDVYDPSPSELPLTEDFSAAAEKRVTPGNYLLELTTIEQELDQLTPKPAPKGSVLATPKRPVSARGVARK